jgi:hypothetical protein
MASLGENIGYNFLHPLRTVLRQKIHAPFSSQKVRLKAGESSGRRTAGGTTPNVTLSPQWTRTDVPRTLRPQRRGIGYWAIVRHRIVAIAHLLVHENQASELSCHPSRQR